MSVRANRLAVTKRPGDAPPKEGMREGYPKVGEVSSTRQGVSKKSKSSPDAVKGEGKIPKYGRLPHEHTGNAYKAEST